MLNSVTRVAIIGHSCDAISGIKYLVVIRFKVVATPNSPAFYAHFPLIWRVRYGIAQRFRLKKFIKPVEMYFYFFEFFLCEKKSPTSVEDTASRKITEDNILSDIISFF